MVRTLVRLAIIAAFPLTLGLTAVGGSAAAPPASIQIHGQGQLQPDHSVVLTIDYSCNPDFFGKIGELFADVQQSGVFGLNFVFATCDDQNHTVSVDVAPGPYSAGTAVVDAQISSFTGVNSAVTQGEIKIQ